MIWNIELMTLENFWDSALTIIFSPMRILQGQAVEHDHGIYYSAPTLSKSFSQHCHHGDKKIPLFALIIIIRRGGGIFSL
jgi:hypothetical protein